MQCPANGDNMIVVIIQTIIKESNQINKKPSRLRQRVFYLCINAAGRKLFVFVQIN